MASTPKSLVLYTARDCSLCERAHKLLARLELAYTSVDITGDENLEERYREWLPVLEIDGERAFVYYIDEQALLKKLNPER